jgi:DNA topoisomerase I
VPETKGGRRRRINDAVEAVAEFLGNTPAICRRSYIDPRVFDRYRDRETIKLPSRRLVTAEQVFDPRVQRSLERAVIRLVD